MQFKVQFSQFLGCVCPCIEAGIASSASHADTWLEHTPVDIGVAIPIPLHFDFFFVCIIMATYWHFNKSVVTLFDSSEFGKGQSFLHNIAIASLSLEIAFKKEFHQQCCS